MKLFLAEHPEKGIWYFSTQAKCAHYIGTHPTSVQKVIRGEMSHTRGWHIEEIEDDNIISKFIDPKRP